MSMKSTMYLGKALHIYLDQTTDNYVVDVPGVEDRIVLSLPEEQWALILAILGPRVGL